MLLIESGLVLLILAAAFVGRIEFSFFRPIERKLASIANHRGFSIFLVGLSAIALRILVLPILPVPYPGVPDEFSYLLMSDTFSHGRLTNPKHPLWVHFETINVIHQPTYCSMYYPAQGMLLSIGQVIGGHPFLGVLLGVGLMCAAICWMLQAWVTPFWALIGGLLVAIRIGGFSYWANSYFGGCLAAAGGALVLGALPRIKRHGRTNDALLMGAGFAILANSRPFESFFFSLPIFAALGLWLWRRRSDSSRLLSHVVLPLAIVLLSTACFMLFYFWRTTGNPFLPPYLLNLRRYSIEPSFPWLPLRPIPHYHHEILQRYYLDYNFMMYQMAHAHPVLAIIMKALMLWFFFLGPLLSLPFLALAFILPYGMSLKDLPSKIRQLLIICAVTLFAVLLPVYANANYVAPITAAIYAFIILAMQRIRRLRFKGKKCGLFLVRSVLGGAVALLLLRVAIPLFHLSLTNSAIPETWGSPWYQQLPREAVEERLQAMSGEHLVVVHYGDTDIKGGWTWVNNTADIDHSKIVWAHDMGPAGNDELIHYFGNRHFWMVYASENPVRLVPYDAASGTEPVVHGTAK